MYGAQNGLKTNHYSITDVAGYTFNFEVSYLLFVY